MAIVTIKLREQNKLSKKILALYHIARVVESMTYELKNKAWLRLSVNVMYS